MKKRLLSAILSIVMLFSLLPVSAFAATVVESGYCGGEGDGTNLSWTLDSDGVLTVTGAGKMKNYDCFIFIYAPWYSKRVGIKSVKIGNSVTSIGDYAFYYCDSLTNVTIGSGVTSIGGGAFEYCSSLTGITIPDSVTSIGSDAFYRCSSLTSVTIPDSVTSIGSSAFSQCSSLTDVYITDLAAWCRIDFDDSPMRYAKNIYCNGKKIVTVTVPDGVTELDYTFYGFNDLIKVALPDSVTSIGSYAFYGCSSLTSITIPSSVTSIGGGAFKYCTSLTSITIPSSVTSIGGGAFEYCSSLTGITIPDSVTGISSAFNGCSSLTSVTIGNSVTSIGDWAFYNCTGLTNVTIGSGVTSIGFAAFEHCDSLTSITIPNSVTSIGNYAFEHCTSLTGVTLGNSVTSIGGSAFYVCSSLTDVYYTGTEAQWNTLKKNIGSRNEPLLNATIHFNYTPAPRKHQYTIVPMPFGDLSVNVSGTATAYFRVEENGVPQPGVMLNYTLNGVAHSAVSDGNGLVAVTTPYVREDTAFSVTFSPCGTDTLTNTLLNFDVTAKDLSYTQEWKGKLKAKGEIGIGPSAGVETPAAKAEASLLKASASAEASGAMTISDSYDNGDRTLQFKHESALGGGLKVKSGIDAGTIGEAKINVIGAKAGVSDTYSTTRGLKLEHYDPKNAEQNLIAGRYLLYPLLNISNSVLTQKILSLIDSKVCNVSGDKNSVLISANAGVGEIKFGGIKGSLGGGNGTAIWSWENTADYTENTTEIKKSFQSTAGYGFGADIGWEKKAEEGENAGKLSLGSYVFGKSISNNEEISAKLSLDDDTVQSISYKTYLGNEAEISWEKESTDTYASVSFSGDNAKTMLNENSELKRFVQGGNPFIDQYNTIGYMSSSGLLANVKETTKTKKGLDIDLPFKLALGVSVGVEAGISGEHSYSYSNKTGVLYQNSSYVTSASDVTTARAKGQSKSLGDIIKAPLSAVWDSFKDGVSSVWDSITDGIENGWAWVKKTGSKWYGKITSVLSGGLQSYGVLTLMSADEPITNAAVSATLGEAYLVELYKDEACTEPVTDEELAASPVTLTLSYNAQMLAQAGAPADADVVLLWLDREKNVYLYEAGGVQDKANMCVTAEVTKNGEYILAVDSLAPIVTDFTASDQTDTPTLSALVSDLSGLRTFRFWLDDGADLVTEENLTDYYNAYTGEFTYAVTDALTPGEHTAHFLASDMLGNEHTKSINFTFEVKQMNGEITAVEVPQETITTAEAFSVIVSTDNTDDITAVGLACYVQDEQVGYYRLERSGDSWQTNVFPIAGVEEMNLVATAYDGFGNTQSYEPVTVRMDVPAQEQGISITEVDCEIDGDTLNVFITAHNSTQNATSGTVMAAAYDADGRMLTVSSAGIGLLPDDDGMVELTMTESIQTAATVKVFLLDPSGNFVPQCQVIEEWTN